LQKYDKTVLNKIGGNKMKDGERTLTISAKPEFIRKVKVHCAIKDIPLKKYIISLIEADLNKEKSDT